MAKTITPGKYRANLIGYQMGETKAGAAQAELMFDWQDADGDRHELIWYGSFKGEKAIEITTRSLVTCGLRRDAKPWDIAQGAESHVLDMSTPVSIVVEFERSQSGKDYPRIKWINRLGGGGFKQGMTPEAARAKLAALGLEGQVAAVRKDLGIQGPREFTPKPRTQPGDFGHDDSFPDDEGLPF